MSYAIGYSGYGSDTSPVHPNFAYYREERVRPDPIGPLYPKLQFCNGLLTHYSYEEIRSNSLISRCTVPTVVLHTVEKDFQMKDVWNETSETEIGYWVQRIVGKDGMLEKMLGVSPGSSTKGSSIEQFTNTSDIILKDGFSIGVDTRGDTKIGITRRHLNHVLDNLSEQVALAIDAIRGSATMRAIGMMNCHMGANAIQVVHKPSREVVFGDRDHSMIFRFDATADSPSAMRAQAVYYALLGGQLSNVLNFEGEGRTKVLFQDYCAIGSSLTSLYAGPGTIKAVRGMWSALSEVDQIISTLGSGLGNAFPLPWRTAPSWLEYAKLSLLLGLNIARTNPTVSTGYWKWGDGQLVGLIGDLEESLIPKEVVPGQNGPYYIVGSNNHEDDVYLPAVVADPEDVGTGRLAPLTTRLVPRPWRDVSIVNGRYAPGTFPDASSADYNKSQFLRLQPMGDSYRTNWDTQTANVIEWTLPNDMTFNGKNEISEPKRWLAWLLYMMSIGKTTLSQAYDVNPSFGILSGYVMSARYFRDVGYILEVTGGERQGVQTMRSDTTDAEMPPGAKPEPMHDHPKEAPGNSEAAKNEQHSSGEGNNRPAGDGTGTGAGPGGSPSN